jgi:hypothetical protein
VVASPRHCPPLSASFRERLLRLSHVQWWILVTLLLAFVGVAFALAFRFVKPAPPRRVVLATASDEGGFKHYARRYARLLKRDGIELQSRETEGSVENVALLSDPASGIDVAFVQSGTAHGSQQAAEEGDQAGGIVSLGRPLRRAAWVFYRGEPVADLSAFKGRPSPSLPAERAARAREEAARAQRRGQAPTTLLPTGARRPQGCSRVGESNVLFFVAPARRTR